MITVNDTLWPLLVVTNESIPDVEQTESYLAKLDGYLSRQENFTLISINNFPDDARHDPQAANRTAKWLKQNKPLISAYCRGMVNVNSSAEYRAKYAAQLNLQGPQIFGCPYIVVASFEEGESWAREQLKKPVEPTQIK